MKKVQIWITAILCWIGFFTTVTAEQSPEDIFSDNIENNEEININSLRIHLSKARIFMKNWKDNKALLEIEKILEVDPTNETALALKQEIIGEPLENIILEENSLESEENTQTQAVDVDYMQIAKDNWSILLILIGSFLAIVFILVFWKMNKKKDEYSYDNYDDIEPNSSTKKEEKDVFAELEDVF